ncbi:MAG: CotH kinase family protein [Lachnospiraceae bacterium]|nr:CotH kinase family protein [Lachnospiraceae bacterium]
MSVCIYVICMLMTCALVSGCSQQDVNSTRVEREGTATTGAFKDGVDDTVASVGNASSGSKNVGATAESTTAGSENDGASSGSQAAESENDGAKTESSAPQLSTNTTEVELSENTSPAIIINEIITSNSKFEEHDGGYFDMIELANISDEDVDLSDYYLSDSTFDLQKSSISGTVPAGGFIVFYCVGDGADPEKNELSFKISSSGETVVLSRGEGNIVERVDVPEIKKNMSYARKSGDSVFEVTGLATFGSGNIFGGTQSLLPEISPADGTRSEGPLEVTFEPKDGTRIFYTTDGSKPDSSSAEYKGKPIKINKTTTLRIYVKATPEALATSETERVAEKPAEALATAETERETEKPAEALATARFSEKEGGASYTFFVGEPDATLDDICVAISAESLEKMNASPLSSTRYAANIAMYHEGEKVFDETCGMNVSGNTSTIYDKKSYRIKFSKKFGESRLHYKLFDNLNIDSFDSVVLRSGSQENEDTIMKDELVPEIIRQSGIVDEVLMTAYRPVNLYIDGEYRGLYYVREHIDGPMIASHYGCEEEDVTVVEQCREIKCGSAGKEWLDLWDYVDKNDLTDHDAYSHVASIVSLESVADYYLIQIWLHNIDPDNVRVYKVGDDKWRYALYDLDLTLTDDGAGGSKFLLGHYNRGLYTFNALVFKLLKNPEFMELFLSRMELLYGKVLAEEKVVPIIDAFVARIDHDMEKSCNLWGEHSDSSGMVYYLNYKTWKRRVEGLKSRLKGRTALVASEFVKLKGVSEELQEKYLSAILK